MRRSTAVAAGMLLVALAVGRAQTAVSREGPLVVGNAGGLQLLVARENTDPTLRISLPGGAASFPVLFPEHVTSVKHGSDDGEPLYMFTPGRSGARPRWRRAGSSLEYERDFPGDIHLLARATLEDDGVRLRYEFTNRSAVAYDNIYAPPILGSRASSTTNGSSARTCTTRTASTCSHRRPPSASRCRSIGGFPCATSGS